MTDSNSITINTTNKDLSKLLSNLHINEIDSGELIQKSMTMDDVTTFMVAFHSQVAIGLFVNVIYDLLKSKFKGTTKIENQTIDKNMNKTIIETLIIENVVINNNNVDQNPDNKSISKKSVSKS